MLERYQAVFGSTPKFEAEHNRIIVAAETTRTRMAGEDAQLANIVREYAERRQQRLASDSISDAVQRTLSEIMHLGDISVSTVAARLKTSERTLRRRLASEDTSFQGLLDEVRFDFAKRYLERPELSTEEIALLLGFSEVSAFYRAFRRWYGANLSDYRQSLSR